jgi:hypothetical protein
MAQDVKSNVVNKEILELSIEHAVIYDGKIPLLYNHFETGESQLLFIGLNPSFSDNIFNSFKTKNKEFKSPWNNKNEYDNFFNSRKIESDDILKIIKVHENSIEYYPYFNKFKEIEKETKKKFAHIDLFHCRRTSQKRFIDDLLRYEKREDYIKKSIKILEVLIKQISPKIIIIENTATRDFLIEYSSFPNINTLDKDSGTPMKDGIPIFYTSMLTGQRALDLGSYHRLIWHVKHCLTLLDIK